MSAVLPVSRLRAWWERPGREAVEGRLRIAGRDAEALAHAGTTPLFVYMSMTHCLRPTASALFPERSAADVGGRA